MNRKIIFVAVVVAATAVVLFFAPRPSRLPREVSTLSESEFSLAKGETLFLQNCMVCHGKDANGAVKGPPLVHRIYEPNHHADAAFYLAVERGVRQHHWKVGDMKPMQFITRKDMSFIVVYVRSLQKKAGIF